MDTYDRHAAQDRGTTSRAQRQDGTVSLAYMAPQLVVLGTTVELVQGHPNWSKYKDYYGWTDYPPGGY